jgi:signal transduction histidine kinase
MVELTGRTPGTAGKHVSREFASTWRTWLPFAFVVLSLLLLFAVPVLVGRHVDGLRDLRTNRLEPARGAIIDVQLALARQEAALRGYLYTREQDFRRRYDAAVASEKDAFRQLEWLARQLDSGLAAEVGALRREADRWGAVRVAMMEAPPEAGGAAPEESLPNGLYEILAGAAAVEATLAAMRHDVSRRIDRTETIGFWATLLLALVALGAALIVAVLGARFRRRAQEERDLRDAAMTLTAAADVEELLRSVAAGAARTGPGRSAYVERIDAAGENVAVVASAGPAAPPEGVRAPFPGSLTEDALRSGSWEIVADLGREQRSIASAIIRHCGACSALLVPLVADGLGHGALVLLQPASRPFRPADARQPCVLGAIAAAALRKAVLLREARERHEELARFVESRARLVRGFSHDLKNPLGAADGHAQLLQDGILGELTERQRESIERVRASVGTALSLVEDLVQLARAEAGELEIEQRAIRPEALLRDLAREYGAAAEAAKLEMEVAPRTNGRSIRSDPRRVRQILGNLLSNAIKYTPEGGRIQLTAEIRQGQRRGDPECWATFSVEDTGPGIPAEARHLLFQEFTRLEPQVGSGAGLGLAISRRIAHLLGGELSLESEPDEGAIFTLWLPCEVPAESGISRGEEHRGAGLAGPAGEDADRSQRRGR